MKTLLKSLLVILFASFALISNAQELKPVTITPHTSKAQVDSLVAQLKNQNINLSFSVLKYNDKGLLVAVKGKVTKKGIDDLGFETDNLHSLVLNLNKNKWGVEVK